jgi:hypothetical protein
MLEGAATARLDDDPVEPEPVAEESAPCELRVTRYSSTEVAGSCTSLTAGTQFESAEATGTAHAVLSVSTGRTIEVTRDADRAVIDLRGGPIDVDTLRVVRGLGESLERKFGTQVLTNAEDVLLRLVLFVGDAHVGFDLERIVAWRPAEADVVPLNATVDDVMHRASNAIVAAGIPAAVAEQLCASTVTTLTPALMAAACQQDGGEGIKYISCYEGRRYTHHDATGHCYTSYYVYAGPCTSNCRGRCGAGCPIVGKQGAYTKDCLDHDYCEATHSSSSCNDELNEAADDFLFAPQWTCDGCNNPH